MKLTTRMLGAALSAAVLGGALAGCGSTAGTFTQLPLPSEVPEDIIMQTAGIARDTPLLTVDGAQVPAEEVLYWVSSYADQYAAWGMTDLTADMGNGQTLGQYYLDSAVETATLYQLMENKAEELKLGWTKDNQTSYDEQLQTMKESLAQQAGLDIETQSAQVDTELVRLISYMGLSQEGFFHINQASFLYNNLMNGLFGTEGTDAPDADKLEEAGVLHAKHILIKAQPVTDEAGNVTDDGMAAAQAQAQELYDQLLSADNQAGYDKYAQVKMQDQIDQWMDEAQVERAEELDSLDLQAYYDGLTTLRSDISAASQADNAPAETTAPETTAPAESAPAETTAPAETAAPAETPAA